MNPGFQTPYPRNNAFRTPRREIDIAAIGEAWGIVTKNLGPFVLAALVMMFLQFAPTMVGSVLGGVVTAGMQNSTDPAVAFTAFGIQTLVGLPFQLIGAALGAVVAGSMVHMAIKAVRGGTPEVGDIGAGFTTAPVSLLVAGFLVGLGTTFGSYLCIIPGLILGGLWFLTSPFIMDKGVGPLDAMRMSWDVMKDHIVMAAVIFLLGGIVAALGVCACFVGILVTMPVLYATQAVIYEDMTSDDQPFGGGYQAPSSDPFAQTPPTPSDFGYSGEQPKPQDPQG